MKYPGTFDSCKFQFETSIRPYAILAWVLEYAYCIIAAIEQVCPPSIHTSLKK